MTSQTQRALQIFDTEGEAAALRHLIDRSDCIIYRHQGRRRFTLPDGSTVSRDRAARTYTFAWPDGRQERTEQPPALFTSPDAESVLHCMLLDIETRATPHGAELPSRGDAPLVTIQEAEAVCPQLRHLLKLEMDCLDPPDDFWEAMDDQVQLMARQLHARLNPVQAQLLLNLTARKAQNAHSRNETPA